MLSKVTVFVLLCVVLCWFFCLCFVDSHSTFHPFIPFIPFILSICTHPTTISIEFTNNRISVIFRPQRKIPRMRTLTHANAHQSAVCLCVTKGKQFVVDERNEKQPHTQRMQRMMILFALSVLKNNASTPSIEHDGTKISKNNNDNVCIVSLYTDRIEMIDIDGILRQFDTARTTSNSSQWILFMDKNSNE